MTDLAQKLSLRLDVTENPCLTSGDYFEIYDSNGKRFDDAAEAKARAYFEFLTKRGKEYLDMIGMDAPLEHLFNVLASAYPGVANFSPRELQFFNWLKAGIEGWENCNLSQLSAQGHYDDDESPNSFGGGDGFVIDGYFRVVHHLAKELLNHGGKVLLSHVVKRVLYSPNKGVAVETDRGSFNGNCLLLLSCVCVCDFALSCVGFEGHACACVVFVVFGICVLLCALLLLIAS